MYTRPLLNRDHVRSMTVSLCSLGSVWFLPSSNRRLTSCSSLQESPPSPKTKKDKGEPPDFYNQCLKRQLYNPKLPYPAWDYNWDGRMTEESTLERLSTSAGLRNSKLKGKTRHILLIRHGQYDETHEDDEKQVLTDLGRRQAELTGRRLSILARGGLGGLVDERFAGPCRIKALHVSGMARAKETAAIIAKYLPESVARFDPDPMLNEALPCPMIPVRPDVGDSVAEIDANRDRIEQAFQKYFHRWSPPSPNEPRGDVDDGFRHEFEVIVGHGNVIRYFLCRALQLPPEAWLRMSVFNCSITYIVIQPNGYVSIRLVGDTGHMTYDEASFSGHRGYNW